MYASMSVYVDYRTRAGQAGRQASKRDTLPRVRKGV